jgi:periplasmic divalent cation tolerance protein
VGGSSEPQLAVDMRDVYVIVLVTCPDRFAEKLAKMVLKRRLAACVNILGEVKSLYWWKGNLDSASESLLLIKTRSELLESLEQVVKRAHPYMNPEIIALHVDKGSRPYLDWIGEETRLSVAKPKRWSSSTIHRG